MDYMHYDELCRQVRACTLCGFHDVEKPPIPTLKPEGMPKIMFIGENPSTKDGIKKPFDVCTTSGEYFRDYYLDILSLKYEDVWITNLFKCRYPVGVDKKSEDVYNNIITCSNKWLREEVDMIKPQIVITMAKKEVYEKLKKMGIINIDIDFESAVGTLHITKVFGKDCLIFPLEHPYFLSINKERLKVHIDKHMLKLKQELTKLDLV